MALDFHDRHKLWYVLVCEVIIFSLMIFDISIYICVKRAQREQLSRWIYLELLAIVAGMFLFLYIYVREERLVQQFLEVTIILARYLIQLLRISIQLKT